LNEYGSVDVLQEIDESVPVPGSSHILVMLSATSINDPDIVMRQNGPFPTMPPEFRPTLPHMIGHDFSGIVTAIGNDVKRFKIGDHVIGFSKSGTYSEFLALDENSAIAKVPSDLDLILLGGLYLTAATAWSTLVTNGKVQPGQKVLIHGAAGGAGSMAVQIAKHFGAHVIGTAGSYSADYLKDLGTDEIIDYKTQDFSKIVHDIDLVINFTGNATLEKNYQVVKRGGRICSTNGVPDQKKASDYGLEAVYALSDLSPETLQSIISLYTAGKLKVHVSKTYPFSLDEIKQAHLDFEKGPNQGKRIIIFDC
jgi:NADPH:quinone reductase-like Zn-dependent oxidoreductase